MQRFPKILVWYLLFLCLAFVAALPMVGRQTLLKYSEKVKPYAVVFWSRNEVRAAKHESDEIIFFFGDSSVALPPWAAKDTPHIPALLDAELREAYPELGGVSVIDWSFPGGRFFHYYCLLFEAENYSPQLLIIPINWRNLGPRSWEWSKENAFHELSALVPFSERRFASGKNIFEREDIPPSKQLIYSYEYPMLYLTGLKMWCRTKVGLEPEEDPLANVLEGLPEAKVLIKRFGDKQLFEQYPVDISADNVQLGILRSLIEASARRGVKLLFYITPIHLDEMRYRQPFDPGKFSESVNRIMEAATSETSTCLNLVDLLGEEDFLDSFEHYTPEGNRKVAAAIAPAVRDSLKPHGSTAEQAGPLALRDREP